MECLQVGFDGGRSKRLNEGDKTIAVTLNLPKGNAAFLDLIATNGITLDTAAYTELMDTTLKKVRHSCCASAVCSFGVVETARCCPLRLIGLARSM
jgi:hypothetical protein